jgi:hypothetical protein
LRPKPRADAISSICDGLFGAHVRRGPEDHRRARGAPIIAPAVRRADSGQRTTVSGSRIGDRSPCLLGRGGRGVVDLPPKPAISVWRRVMHSGGETVRARGAERRLKSVSSTVKIVSSPSRSATRTNRRVNAIP